MDCKRKGCGHPLALHDPCSRCQCRAYEPAVRKERTAKLTDIADVPARRPTIADARAADEANLRKAAERG